MPELAAEAMDRLCTVEMKSPGQARGLIVQLYDAARAEAGEPLSFKAASLLVERAEPGRPVLFTAAAGTAPWLPQGETDGPLGAAAIARALADATGAVPMFVSAASHAGPVAAAARASGLVITDPETALTRSSAAAMLPFEPGDDTDAAVRALIERHRPAAVVSVETLGPNRAGIPHSVMGLPFEGAPAYAALFSAASELGVATVGVGDGGNEIGFGRIREHVQAIHEWGETCQCPCGQGIATTQAADALVVASISNWGAYAVAAMIALLTGRPGAFHDAGTERRMLEACLAAGGSDGVSATHAFAVDGVDGRVSADLVHMLSTILRKAMERVDRPF